MKNTSTHYLLKHLYNETEPTETLAIEDALANNWHLKETYSSWVELLEMLNEARVAPSDKLIDNILKHSKDNTFKTLS